MIGGASTYSALQMSIDAADMIGLWFQCDPVEKLWNTPLPGVCNNKQAVVTLSMAAGGKLVEQFAFPHS